MFYLVQAGSALQVVQEDGSVETLTLPTDVTIDASLVGRSAVLGQQIVFIGAGSVNLWVDPLSLVVRPMSLLPPLAAPVLSTSGTGLTGAFRAKVSYAIKDENGVVLNESPLSPPSLPIDLSDQGILYSHILVSPQDAVNCRRVYRTLTDGAVYFRVLDIDENESTSLTNAMADTALSLLPADPALGNPAGAGPGERLTLITEWKNRLWAVASRYDLRDHLFYSDEGRFFAWPVINDFPIYPLGEDSVGITGFLARRDALGVLKRRRVLKVVGSSNIDFEVIIVVEKQGCIAPDSCVVIDDVGYFLGEDGVYEWSDDGVRRISEAEVDPWFTTDDYFNREEFPNAKGAWNPTTNAYELQLASAGQATLDRWVAFHIDEQKWLGPHRTAAATPTCRGLLRNDDNDLIPAIGASDMYIYKQNQPTPSDVAASAQAIDGLLRTKWHSAGAPDIHHFWGQLSVLSRIESGGTLAITPYVGRLNASAGAAISVDLTLGRQRLRRLGVGPLCSLEFRNNTAGQRFLLYGYEINPVFEVGRR